VGKKREFGICWGEGLGTDSTGGWRAKGGATEEEDLQKRACEQEKREEELRMTKGGGRRPVRSQENEFRSQEKQGEGLPKKKRWRRRVQTNEFRPVGTCWQNNRGVEEP